MNIEKIKLTDITEADYNPRFISEKDMDKLKNSLKTFGLVDPIIINYETGVIIGGHQRYNALIELAQEDNILLNKEYNLLKLGDIGWVFDNTNINIKSKDYEKALNLALNKISGEWDIKKLQLIFDDLKLSDLDSALTGFDDLEIAEIEINNDIEYDDYTGDIEEDYTEPTPDKLICPNCGHVDYQYEFKKEEKEDDNL